MASTATAVGSPTINTQAAGTVAARKMRPGQMAPGRFSAQRFQNPGAGSNRARTVDRSRFQGAGGSRPQFRQMQGYDQRGGQVPGQYQTPGKPPMGGGGQGPQFPGGSDWWQNRPQPPPQRMWGSPQFNFMGGNAPSAQPGGGPNWGGGGTPSWMGGGQQGRGGYGQMNPGGQVPGQYQTPGIPGGRGYGGGMPQGGMPGYQGQQHQNNAYQTLQNRVMEQQMLASMPAQLRNQYRFDQGADALGYSPEKDSRPGDMFEGYGQNWGPVGGQYAPWSGTWRNTDSGRSGGGWQGAANAAGNFLGWPGASRGGNPWVTVGGNKWGQT